MAVGKINILMKADSKQFESSMRKVKGKLKGMGSAALSFASIAGPALAAFGGAALKAHANIEKLETSFTIMTKSAEKSKRVMSQLTTFTAKTPFQLNEVANSARQIIAATGKTKGLTKELKMLGDLAAVTNVPLTDMARIYSKAFNKGKLQAEELNQLAERGIPIIGELADMYGVTREEIFKMGSQGLISFEDMKDAMQNMTSESGIAFDAMQKQSETLSGKWSTLSDNTTLAMAEIGEAISRELGVGGWMDELTRQLGNIAWGFSMINENAEKTEKTFNRLGNKGWDFTDKKDKKKTLKTRKTPRKVGETDSGFSGYAYGNQTPWGDLTPFEELPKINTNLRVTLDLMDETGDELTNLTEKTEKLKFAYKDWSKAIDFAGESLGRLTSIHSQSMQNQMAELTTRQESERAMLEAAGAGKEALNSLDERHAAEREKRAKKAAESQRALASVQAVVMAAQAQLGLWANTTDWTLGFAGKAALSGVLAGITAAEVAVINGASFAQGTSSAPPGLSLVGERGPEYVRLPAGSSVYSNGMSQGMGGGGEMKWRIQGDELLLFIDNQRRKSNFR